MSFGGGGRTLERYAPYFDEVDYIVDSKVKPGEMQTSSWRIPIFSPDILRDEASNRDGGKGLLIAISSRKYMNEIISAAKKLAPYADIIHASEYFVHKAAFYGQYGEDAIINSFFRYNKITQINYLEIGIPDPIILSNTFHFYLNGHQGVLVEANPDSKEDLMRVRPRDIVVSCGCGSTQDEGKDLDFFVQKDSSAINTFSKEAVSFWETTKGLKYEKIIKVPMLSINTILDRYFEKAPNLISIDIEAYEYNVLKDMDFEKWNSDCFCIEKSDVKVKDLLLSNGYSMLAETPVNWILVLNKYVM